MASQGPQEFALLCGATEGRGGRGNVALVARPKVLLLHDSCRRETIRSVDTPFRTFRRLAALRIFRCRDRATKRDHESTRRSVSHARVFSEWTVRVVSAKRVSLQSAVPGVHTRPETVVAVRLVDDASHRHIFRADSLDAQDAGRLSAFVTLRIDDARTPSIFVAVS